MVDITVTASAVLPNSNAVIDRDGTVGEAIDAGQVVYKAAATGKYGLADANGATTEIKTPVGIALNKAAADGQPIAVLLSGDLTMNAVLTAGARYYTSSTAGGIQPEADLGAGEYVALIGLAKSTTVLSVKIHVPGVTL